MNTPSVLLVDDEPSVLASLERVLRRESYEVVTAGSAADALRLLANGDFAVLVTDRMMPAIDGTRLLEAVRKVSPDTVSIMLTGYPELNAALQAINQGAVFRLLTKPWDDDKLRRAICEALLRSRLLRSENHIAELLPDLLEASSETCALREVIANLLAGSGLEIESVVFQSRGAGADAGSPPHLLIGVRGDGRLLGMLEVQFSEETHDLPAVSVLQHPDVLSRLSRTLGLALDLLRRTCDLRRQSSTDGLTDLHNRRSFDARLRAEYARCQRYGRALSLLLIDVDHFKHINDTHGHLTGDAALAEVGNLLRQFSRTSDAAYRFGGDEFAVLLPETELQDACNTAGRLQEAAAALGARTGPGPEEKGSALRGLTLSVGVATVDADCKGPEFLVYAADQALYSAKRNGRDRVHYSQGGRTLEHRPASRRSA